MAKRIMLSVVGAGIGSLAGLLVSFLGVGNYALIVGALAGAVIPLMVMGPPGRLSRAAWYPAVRIVLAMTGFAQ